jgi:pentatricopeptide repeat protein
VLATKDASHEDLTTLARAILRMGADNWNVVSIREQCAERLEKLAEVFPSKQIDIQAAFLRNGYTDDLLRHGWHVFEDVLRRFMRKKDSTASHRVSFALLSFAATNPKVDPAHLVLFVARNWDIVTAFLEVGNHTKHRNATSVTERVQLTLQIAHSLGRLEPSPPAWAKDWLSQRNPHLSDKTSSRVLGLIAYALQRTSSASDALYVWRLYPAIPAKISYGIASALVSQGDSVEAKEALALLSREGTGISFEKIEHLESRLLGRMHTRTSPVKFGPHQAATVDHIRARAEAGDVEGVRRILSAHKESGLVPRVRLLYTELVRAHIVINDMNGAMEVFETMKAEGIPYNVATFNALLQGYTQAVDLDGAIRVIDDMREAGIAPNVATYTCLVNLYGVRKEPDRAKQLFDVMRAEGIEPDRIAYTSLMNAYVEAGIWDDAIKTYRFLERHPNFSMRPDTTAMGVLLKAYVVLGAPLSDTIDVYRELAKRGAVAGHVYALVLQACCDASAMGPAEEVFGYLDRPGSTVKPDIFHFSIMINGFLRLGQRKDAQDYYTEMKSRMLRPTSITGAIIVGAYARELENESMEKAELIARQMVEIVRSSRGENRHYRRDRRLGMGREAETIYAPLISAAVHLIDPERATEYLKRAASEGLPASMALVTSLLDAYRRVADFEALYRVWDIVYDQALETAGPDGQVPPSQNNFLCLPLSIMIKALSSAGRFGEVTRLWADVRNRGFGFDVANWNHLAVALVLAGQLRRAFWILEYIILATEEAAAPTLPTPALPEEIRGSRDREGDEVTDPGLESSTLVDPSLRPPNRAHQNRIGGPEELDNAHLIQFNLDGVVTSDVKWDAPTFAGRASDLSRGLREARYKKGISMWRIHNETLDTVEDAFLELLRGGHGGAAEHDYLVRMHPKTIQALSHRRIMVSDFNLHRRGQRL